MKLAIAASLVVVCASSAFAQVDPGAVRQRKPNQCLSDTDLATNKELKALNRPTAKADHNWVFDPDYLLGTWTFEWDVPETPISSGGKTTGSYTFKRVEDCFYEGTAEGKTADGPFQSKVLVVYNPELKHMTWLETDSRGFSMLRTGRIAGDLGGYFTFHWEAPPFTFKEKVIRMSGTTFFSSPTTFRYRPRISIDGDDYINYGNPWFTRAGGTPSSPKP